MTPNGVVSSLRHHEDPGWLGGGAETPLSAVRPSGTGVPPREALDMYGSPHLPSATYQMGVSGLRVPNWMVEYEMEN